MSLKPNQFRIPKEYDYDPEPMSLTVFMDDLHACKADIVRHHTADAESNESERKVNEAFEMLIADVDAKTKRRWEDKYPCYFRQLCMFHEFASWHLHPTFNGLCNKLKLKVRRKKEEDLEAEMEELRKENREKDLALIELTKEHAQLEADYQDVMLKMEEPVCHGCENGVESR